MKLSDLPQITFADADPEIMEENAVKIMEKLINRKINRADPVRLFLKAFINIIVQQRLLIDETGKQNLLAYSTGDNLEHLGILVGVERMPASYATATVLLKLSAPREKTTTIKKGTRISAGDNIFFALDNDVIFLAGETEKTEKVTCQEAGEIGNKYKIGELSTIIDPQAFLSSIENITESDGGADIESDEDFRERIREAPESFSVAGSFGAYEYHTKQVSNLIADVCVISEEPGEVSIFPLMRGGELPSEEMKNKILDAVSADNVRPLTDLVFVKSPTVHNFDIDLRYYIARSDAISAATIQQNIETAINEYIDWQKSKLGRDVNKTELEYKIRAAGAKRVEIFEPHFFATDKMTVAIAQNLNAVYAGLEDD